ncbi:MAG: dephospho-CoA kinase, partial [Planctomycetota bacterium]
DIPLLLEAGWAEQCDLLLFVESPQNERLARAAARGWDADELAWREAAQTPIAEKRDRADAVVLNSGSPSELKDAVDLFWRQSVVPLGD